MKDILPIGTIVGLKENDEIKFMIIGYFPTNKEGENRDYSAVRYPVGVYDNRMFFFFNHSDVSSIHYMGYKDNEFESMTKLISESTTLMK